ncbi:N-acetyltransferase family protein [Terrabacter sp. MAHUQ-38]|uniref:GNAT family N-acetyltransferase n=1 Tax=unclassified Terrabacter TaxID=2630222 RepID=UPI00351C2F69
MAHEHEHTNGHAPDHPHGHGHDHGHSHLHEAGPVADASVRVARVSDAPAVGLVQAVVWREAYAGVLPDEVVEQFDPRPFTNAWRASLGDAPSPDHLLLVACAGEQVVGFAAVGPSPDPDGAEAAELLVLGVHPDARRQGHGSRLLNAAVDTARGRGAGMLTAWVLADADETRGFLTSAGLEADGAHRERVVSEEGRTAREVRLSATVVDAEEHAGDLTADGVGATVDEGSERA